ncbi:MAG: PilT/PilU family type 4a pilus ATPase [Candidatus Peribacteraceae bacterium]|nr:PilT/PilU family type 4a pilus ATPase [Candidatus Peribacteraceae bacterium]
MDEVKINFDLKKLLDLAIEKSASDIHFGAGQKTALRIFGDIHLVESLPVPDEATAEEVIFGMLKGEAEIEKLKRDREFDFSYEHTDGTNFRCNAFFRSGRIALVMRQVDKLLPSLEEIGLPTIVHDLIKQKQGLILMCGPTGSGKSTTLRSMLEEINETRVEHVITIEDPIEFVFTNKKCIFSQRELNYDTHSFDAALRVALREDPDVVMVGEMRDRDTITAALNLCETGHLVLSTLHTNSASQTVNRLMQAFSLDQRNAVLARLADSLIAIISQRLVPKKGGGRIAIFELMITTSAIRNAIRKGDTPQLDNTIATSSVQGMISMRRFAEDLIQRGIIDREHVEPFLKRDEH